MAKILCLVATLFLVGFVAGSVKEFRCFECDECTKPNDEQIKTCTAHSTATITPETTTTTVTHETSTAAHTSTTAASSTASLKPTTTSTAQPTTTTETKPKTTTETKATTTPETKTTVKPTAKTETTSTEKPTTTSVAETTDTNDPHNGAARKRRDVATSSAFKCYKRTNTKYGAHYVTRGCMPKDETCPGTANCCNEDLCNGALPTGVSYVLMVAFTVFAVLRGTPL